MSDNRKVLVSRDAFMSELHAKSHCSFPGAPHLVDIAHVYTALARRGIVEVEAAKPAAVLPKVRLVVGIDRGSDVDQAAYTEMVQGPDGVLTVTKSLVGLEAEAEIARREAEKKPAAPPPKGSDVTDDTDAELGAAIIRAYNDAGTAHDSLIAAGAMVRKLLSRVTGKLEVARNALIKEGMERDAALSEFERLTRERDEARLFRVHPRASRANLEDLCRYLNEPEIEKLRTADMYPGMDIAKAALIMLKNLQERLCKLEDK